MQQQKTEKLPLTMPSEKVSVKAVYEAGDRYSVMVFGGTGAGIYEEGEIVTVTADRGARQKVQLLVYLRRRQRNSRK